MKIFIGFALFIVGLIGLMASWQDSIWWIHILCYIALGVGLDLVIDGKIDEAKEKIKKEIIDEIEAEK